ncbi:MAG: DNA primase large subunit PriL [Candidatus Bathyarchaeia archaeon]
MISERDKALYPFTVEAAEFVKSLGIRLEDLTTEPCSAILKRAEERIRQALLNPSELSPQEQDPNIEVPSFPAAIMLMAYVGNEAAKRRYAVAESKSFSKRLREESPEKIMSIAKRTFAWRIRQLDESGGHPGEFLLHFKEYLTNTRGMNELKWKLTNRTVSGGYVQLTKDEATRLIEEEIQRKILEKTRQPLADPPDALQSTLNAIRGLTSIRSPPQEIAQTFKISIGDMPPCIRARLDTLASGGRLSHIGRFTLTSFLVSSGSTEDDVMGFFKSASDYDERKTRYQVEHISGRRGSKTKYTPPKCDTLKTHGLCIEPDELCKGVRHPLTYYRRKQRQFRRLPAEASAPQTGSRSP